VLLRTFKMVIRKARYKRQSLVMYINLALLVITVWKQTAFHKSDLTAEHAPAVRTLRSNLHEAGSLFRR